MNKYPHFSDSTIERRAREADVISRAKAARPVQGGKDRLDQTQVRRSVRDGNVLKDPWIV